MFENSEHDQIMVKIIVVGDCAVGKTSILTRYCYDRYYQNPNSTVGCDFSIKIINDDRNLQLQLWDIAGQEKFQSVSKMFIRGAAGCVIVSDIANPESLVNTITWKRLIEDNCNDFTGYKIPMILLQNKCDLYTEKNKIDLIDRDVDSGEKEENDEFDLQDDIEINAFWKIHNFDGFFRVSAKENINISDAFNFLLNLIVKRNIIQDLGNAQKSLKSSRISTADNNEDKKKNKNCKC